MEDEFQSSAVLKLVPDFLLDLDTTLKTLRQSKLERCNVTISLCDSHIAYFEDLDYKYSEFENNHKLKCNKLKENIKALEQKKQTKQKELLEIEQETSMLEEMITNNFPNMPEDNEITELFQRMKTLKEESESQKKAIQHDFEQFKTGIKCYKKHLVCNVIYRSKEEVIFTLNPFAKDVTDIHEFIKFTTNDKATTFQFVEMHPKLEMEQSLVKRFNETGDIQGFILSFMKAVKQVRTKVALREPN